MMWVEKGFDSNDYFVLAAVMVSWGIYFYMPKIFSKQITVLIFLYTLTAAGIFDNSFGAPPFDFYDIMDGPAYTGMDSNDYECVTLYKGPFHHCRKEDRLVHSQFVIQDRFY